MLWPACPACCVEPAAWSGFAASCCRGRTCAVPCRALRQAQRGTGQARPLRCFHRLGNLPTLRSHARSRIGPEGLCVQWDLRNPRLRHRQSVCLESCEIPRVAGRHGRAFGNGGSGDHAVDQGVAPPPRVIEQLRGERSHVGGVVQSPIDDHRCQRHCGLVEGPAQELRPGDGADGENFRRPSPTPQASRFPANPPASFGSGSSCRSESLQAA